MSDIVLYELCRRARIEKGSEASLNAIQQWLNDNEENQELLEQAINYTDDKNIDTPLHCLLKVRPPDFLVERFIELGPNTPQVQNKWGSVPLIVACIYGVSDDIVRMLLETYGEGAHVHDTTGALALHYACRYGGTPEVLKMLLGGNQLAAQVQTNEGDLALHIACYNNPTQNVIRMLIEAYPDATQVRNKLGSVPLHLACWFEASPDVVKTLLEVNRAAAKVRNHLGNFPIHLACSKKPSVDVVRLMLEAYQNGAQKQNFAGNLPLHRACINGASQDIVSMLLQAHPDSAQVTNRRNELPLHCACSGNAELSLEVLKLLVGAFHQSTTIRDKMGKVPLALALEKSTVSTEIRLLISPTSDMERDISLSAATLSSCIWVTNETEYTLHVTLNQGMSSEEISAVAPKSTEEYLLDEGCGATRVTIKDNDDPNLGWIQNKLVKSGGTFGVEGPPKIHFK